MSDMNSFHIDAWNTRAPITPDQAMINNIESHNEPLRGNNFEAGFTERMCQKAADDANEKCKPKDNADGWEGIQDAIKLMEEASVPSWTDVDYYQLGYEGTRLPIWCSDDEEAEYNNGSADRQREKGDE